MVGGEQGRLQGRERFHGDGICYAALARRAMLFVCQRIVVAGWRSRTHIDIAAWSLAGTSISLLTLARTPFPNVRTEIHDIPVSP